MCCVPGSSLQAQSYGERYKKRKNIVVLTVCFIALLTKCQNELVVLQLFTSYCQPYLLYCTECPVVPGTAAAAAAVKLSSRYQSLS